MNTTMSEFYHGDFKLAISAIVNKARSSRSLSFVTDADAAATGDIEHDRRAALLCSLIAALAEDLDIDVPHWALASRYLPDPYFPSGFDSIRPWLLAESPSHFRRNNIFVSKDILDKV
jgi:hypothetical protein